MMDQIRWQAVSTTVAVNYEGETQKKKKKKKTSKKKHQVSHLHTNRKIKGEEDKKVGEKAFA
jgi:hypothetical protein